MNNIQLKDINGILNYLSKSEDFFKEYIEANKSYGYSMPMLYGGMKCGLIIETNENKSLDIDISIRSYLNLKVFSDKQTRQIPTSQTLFNIISNFYNVNIVLFFIEKEERGIYFTHVILEKDSNIFCSNVFISDAVCMSKTMHIPIYINRKIIETKAIFINNLKYKMGF